MSLPGFDDVRSAWQNPGGAAKRVWVKSTKNGLLHSNQSTHKSAGAIHKRYAISRAEADAQVRTFFHNNKY